MALPAGRVGVAPDQVDRNGKIIVKEKHRRVLSGTGADLSPISSNAREFDGILFYQQLAYPSEAERGAIVNHSTGEEVLEIWMGTVNTMPKAITIPLMKDEIFDHPATAADPTSVTWYLVEI